LASNGARAPRELWGKPNDRGPCGCVCENWLVKPHTARYGLSMSATELIRQVQNLSSREREKLLSALLKLDATPFEASRKSRRIKWPDVEARAKRIFGKRMFPNLVLLERQERVI
jgi:hypothetical protein